MTPENKGYSTSVFLNVPFDRLYRSIFDALVFAVHDCGFVARSAFETDDGTQPRIEKLLDIIGSSKYGIHDISRTGLTGPDRLPRFNMPLELGLFMGAKHFGGSRHEGKCGLVLDPDRYRYQKFCSDVAGQDVRTHENDPDKAIRAVRSWLCSKPEVGGRTLPGADHIAGRYRRFRSQLPRLCKPEKLDSKDLHFVDYVHLAVIFLRENP